MGVSVDKKMWMQQGLLLQISKDQYLLGQGPFKSSSKSCFGFYIPDFFLQTKESWIIPQKYCLVSEKDLIDFLGQDLFQKKDLFKTIIRPSFLEFQKIFYQIQNQIKSSNIQKIVPVFFEELQGQVNVGSLLKKFFKRNKFSYKKSYLYGYWNKGKGLLGLSPEILFSVKEQSFYTMALAGTSIFPGASLFQNEKEIKEHQYVIKSIEESLKDLVSWKKEKTYEKRFGNIKHLCTEKEAVLIKAFDYVKFCHKLHPTAALGSYPKQEGLSWLKKQNQQIKRTFFGAPFGYFNGKDTAFCLVAIRNLEWRDSKIRIYSGGGIIRDSILQKEWRELFLKREQVKRIFL